MNKTQLQNLKIGDKVQDAYGMVHVVNAINRNDDHYEVSYIFSETGEFHPDDVALALPVEWYARANGIPKIGPYASQVEAWEDLIAADGSGQPMHGSIVWPQYKKI